MTVPPGVLDYFALEAADCLERLRRWREGRSADAAAPTDDARRAARTLRGAAGVAREPEFAELGRALEQLLGAPAATLAAGGPALDRTVDEALDAAAAALAAPRPLPPGAVDRLRAATASVDALGGGAGGAPAALDDANARVVPVRSLAHDGDAAFIVYRAPAPPERAGRRFRQASAPLARALRRLVAEARAAAADGAAPAAVAQTIGADLRAAVVDVRELAESYDIAPAAEFFARREAGAAALEARTLAAVDAAAAGLLGEAPAEAGVAEPTPEAAAPAPAPAAGPDDASADHAAAPPDPAADFRPPTGEALVALLETGISGLGAIGDFAGAPVAPDAAAEPPAPAPDPEGVVAVETLLYRGPAALERAREVRDALRARPGPPDPALLDELYDLLDLAAT